jgi:hypothetical protein
MNDMVARTWTGQVNNDASNPGNWSPIGAPQPGDMLTDTINGSTIDIRDNALAGNGLLMSAPPSVVVSSATLNLSHAARVDLFLGVGTQVVANVSGVDTLNASVPGSVSPRPGGALTVNLDHAILFGSFNIGNFPIGPISGGSVTITSENRPALFINNATDTVSGGSADIDVDVVGKGTFNVTAGFMRVLQLPGRIEFGGFVSGGETVSVSGSVNTTPPGPAISSVVIEQPREFFATVDLHDFSLADLVGLAQADSWSYKNDLLSIKTANGKVIDRLHVVSDASSTGSVHGLSVSKNAAGDVLVSPGTDFQGSLAPTSVVYSNFGPGMSFDSSGGYVVSGGFPGDTERQAVSQQFTPSANYTFDDAEVAVSNYTGPNTLTAYLQADSNGLPGAVIEAIPIVAPSVGTEAAVLTADSTLFPVLQSGTPYWLTLVAAPNHAPDWNFNSIGDTSNSTIAFTLDGSPSGPWHPGFGLPPRAAFEINGGTIATITKGNGGDPSLRDLMASQTSAVSTSDLLPRSSIADGQSSDGGVSGGAMVGSLNPLPPALVPVFDNQT